MRRLFRAIPASCLALLARSLVVALARVASPYNQIDFCMDSLQPRCTLPFWTTGLLDVGAPPASSVRSIRPTDAAGSACEMAIDRRFSGRSDPCEQCERAFLIDVENIHGLSAADAETVESLCSKLMYCQFRQLYWSLLLGFVAYCHFC